MDHYEQVDAMFSRINGRAKTLHFPRDALSHEEREVAILARGLRKSYPGVEAVRGVDLTVGKGQAFAFLGPNGAGKSTTIAMLCTLLRPTSGHAEVAGVDVLADPAEVRRHIGVVFQESTVDGDLTVMEHMRLHADLYAIPMAGLPDRIAELIDLVDLGDHAHRRVHTFSGGMRRRLEVARGLLHAPEVLFLDEPTIGLDPQSRRQIWAHLRRVRQVQGTTLFLTTHYLDEAEYCDRIAIIDDGRILVEGSPSELKRAIGGDRVRMRTADDEAAAGVLRDRFDLVVDGDRDGLAMTVPDGAAFVPRACGRLGVPILSVTVTEPSLDDVFMHHTGRTIRDTSP